MFGLLQYSNQNIVPMNVLPSQNIQICIHPLYSLYFIPNFPSSYPSPYYNTEPLYGQPTPSLTVSFSIEKAQHEENQHFQSSQVHFKEKSSLRIFGVVQKEDECKQKFGRNIYSNVFHMMVKFTKKEKKMRQMVLKVIQSNNMAIKPNEFYQMIKNRSYKLKAYANSRKIAQFWRGPVKLHPVTLKNQKQIECTIIFRILGRHYLKYCHFPYVYGSQKIKSQSKKLHMETIRKILTL